MVTQANKGMLKVKLAPEQRQQPGLVELCQRLEGDFAQMRQGSRGPF